MYLETRTTELVDSLEVASLKFLNSVTEHYEHAAQAGAAQPGAARTGTVLSGAAQAASGVHGVAAVRSRDDLRGANRT
jgi:hypothetical protein